LVKNKSEDKSNTRSKLLPQLSANSNDNFLDQFDFRFKYSKCMISSIHRDTDGRRASNTVKSSPHYIDILTNVTIPKELNYDDEDDENLIVFEWEKEDTVTFGFQINKGQQPTDLDKNVSFLSCIFML
jgi:hypothetical protein